MKYQKNGCLRAKELGELYSDIKTKNMRHRFLANPCINDQEIDNLCILDMSVEDIRTLGFTINEENGWSLDVPVHLFNFEWGSIVKHGSKDVQILFAKPK